MKDLAVKKKKRTSTCRTFDEALGHTPRAEQAKAAGMTATECARDGMTIDEIMYVGGCTYGTARTLKYNAASMGFDVPDEGSESRAIPRAERIKSLVMEGKSNAEIAELCEVSIKTASYYRSVLRREGKKPPRSPAPRRPERAQVEKLIQEGRFTHAEIANQTGTYDWYVASVAQDLREGGYRRR